MSNNELMTQTEFAEFYGVSQPMVARYIQQGKIPKSCIVQDGRYKKIKVQCAVDELERNLDPIKRKPRDPEPIKRKPLTHEENLTLMKEYEEFISFNVDDLDELGAGLALALDILSYLAVHLNEQSQNRMERNLEDIADIFGCRRVNVENLTGKRCIPVEQ